MSKYKVDICHIQSASLKVLTSEEMTDLFRKYQATKDERYKEELVMGNLKLVLSMVQRFSKNNYNLDDLFQVGCVGLIKAIENFDLSVQVQFSTYAVPMILGEMRRYTRETSMLRVSRYLRDISYRASLLKEKYMQEHGKEPDLEMLAHLTGVDIYELQEALNAKIAPASLSEPMPGDENENLTIAEKVPDKQSDPAKLNDLLALNEAMNHLNKKERWLIEKRYYQGKTQSELASELFVSQAQVSRLEKSALQHLRHYL